jgi:hypothetical protein
MCSAPHLESPGPADMEVFQNTFINSVHRLLIIAMFYTLGSSLFVISTFNSNAATWYIDQKIFLKICVKLKVPDRAKEYEILHY